MKLHLGKLSLAVFLNFSMFLSSVQAELSQITFEAVEWVPSSYVNDFSQPGWNVLSGNARVSPVGEGFGGGKALWLPAGAEPETMVTRQVSWNATDQTAFIDMQIKPAADPEGSLATFFANGTQLAFQVEQESGTGSIWVYHGNDGASGPGAQPEQWVQTVGSFYVPAGATEADAYVRITLRHDYQRNLWDLFVDGKMAAANLSFEGRGANLTSVEYYGSLVGDTRVDNLAALTSNMLFADADKDGLSDAWENANGSNPNLYDRDAIKPGTGTSFLDLYMASLWTAGGVNASKPISASGGIPPITILGNHQPVGAVKGSLSVGGDGSASYSVPIDVPKGTAGMEPKLSLGYSSGASAGQSGLGWAVSGLQRITRGPCSIVKDGLSDPVDFDDNDRFFLDGERLVCVEGTYGAAGSVYRTEIDAFSRITAIGSGPDYWKVETKAGLVMELGNTEDSKSRIAIRPSYTLAPTPPNNSPVLKVSSWGVNKVLDTLGNYYSVEYTRDAVAGQPFEFINDRVSAINYTGNALQNKAPYCKVLFDYGEALTNPDRPDKSRAYSTYAGVKATRLLRNIVVKTGDYVNHSYQLGYTTSYQTGRSLLTSITKMMEGKSSKSIPPTTFTYDGLQSSESIWLDPGPTQLPTYSTNVDATQDVNSVVTTEDNNATIRLTGDVSRAYAIPLVNVVSGMKIQFDFKSDKMVKGAIIGLDNDTIYQSPGSNSQFDPAPPTALYRIGGTGTIRLAPDEPLKEPNFVGTAQAYTVGQGWKSFTLDATKFGTGNKGYLVLMCADDTIADGTDEALFRNVKIYNSNTQQAANVAPIIFNLDTELPRYLAADGKDLGVVSLDLDGDGLPDLTDWRATNYSTTSGILNPATNGNVYRNTGSDFVLDNTLRPPAALPLTVRAADDTAYNYAKRHHFLAQPMDVDGDNQLELLASVDIQKNSSVVNNRYAFYSRIGGVWTEKTAWALPFRIASVASSESNGERRDHHFQFADLNQDGYPDLLVFTTTYGRLYDITSGTQIAAGDASVAYLNKGRNGPGWIRDDTYAVPERLAKTYSTPKDEGKKMTDLEGDGIQDIAQSVVNNDVVTSHTYKMTGSGPGYRWNSTIGQENPPVSIHDMPIPMVNNDGTSSGGLLVDVNADGLPDILRYLRGDTDRRDTYINQANRNYPSSAWALESSTVSADSYHLPLPMHRKNEGIIWSYGYETADINGDGLTDILYSNEPDTYTANLPDNVAIMNTGNGWQLRTEFRIPDAHLICTSGNDRKDGKRRSKLQDINGDGFPDLITDILGQTPRVWYNQCRPEVLKAVTDGFGSQLTVEYKRMNDPTPMVGGYNTRVYIKGPETLPAGQAAVLDSRLMVSRYSEPDGLTVHGRRWKAQRYSDLRYDRYNEASLGFGKLESMDELTGQLSETFGYQVYPFNGSPALTKTYVPVTTADLAQNGLGAKLPGVTAGMKLMSIEEAVYSELTPQAGIAGGTIHRPIQTGSTQIDYDLAGSFTTPYGTAGAKKSEVVTTQTFDSYGFATQSTAVSMDGSTVTTSNTYNHITSAGRWHLGRLSASQVVKSGGGKPTITKNSSFGYDGTTGLLTSETVESTITKSYTHDGFGNVISTAVTTGGVSRTSSSIYDATGRFLIREQNQLGQFAEIAYDPARALILSSTDINGLTNTYTYDAFGTKILTHNPDGTKTAEITGYASNASLPSSVASQTSNPIRYFRATQSSGGPVATVYLDAMGRELVKETTILRDAYATDSTRYSQVYATTCYDSRGRKTAFSEPFGAGESPKFTVVAYDMLNRPIITAYEVTDLALGVNQAGKPKDAVIEFSQKTSTPASTANPCSYSKVANRNGMTLERWEDQHGRFCFSRDPSNQTTTFSHDHEGKLLTVAIEGSGTLLTNTYDILGNKIQVTEANSGTTTSVYNGFGEATQVTNAKSQITTSTYDSLGRVLTVSRPEGTYTTTYDTAPGAGKGKPWKTTGPDGYESSIDYDGYGRPVTSRTKVRNQALQLEEFTTTTTYTALGLPFWETDAGGLPVVHEYDATYSFPLSLKIGMGLGIVGAGTLLWHAGSYDSKGRPTSQKLAQGIDATASYNPNSGMLENLTSVAGSTTLQNKSCLWDDQGNLTYRSDNLTRLKETFGYDSLNRVVTATTALLPGATITTVPPPQSYTYDSKGNLLTKAGAAMNYDGSRPHAVATATVKGESRTYAYDAAGYVTSDTRRSYDWSSFGQLRLLDYAAAPSLKDLDGNILADAAQVQTTFSFDAGGSRLRQFKERIASGGSRQLEETLYLGDYEREEHTTKASNTASPVLTKTVHRHTLGDIGVYTRAVNASTGTTVKLTTVLKDHLGSTACLYIGTWNGTAFVNQIVEGQSFDPWGERRDANTWTNFRAASGDSHRTSAQDYDRGYTGHEQLDESGLIHMNGRIYDPEIGRFLSPDPYVQVPEYSQNFNRYSYVLNNPLNAIDPSGFSFISKVFHKKLGWLKENWRTVVVIVVVALVTIFSFGTLSGAAAAWGTLVLGATASAAVGAVATMMVGGAVMGAFAGGLGAALAGGDMGDVLRGAAIGAISGAATGALHFVGSGTGFSAANAANVVGHGIVGGLRNMAMGGKFGDGFLSAAASAASSFTGLTNPDSSPMNIYGRTAVAGVVGGTASVLGGGKFSNGAGTAAFDHLINAEGSKLVNKLNDKQVETLKGKFGSKFDTQLSDLNKTPTGRQILAYLADNAGKWNLSILETGRSQVVGNTLSLNIHSNFATLAHESQHLIEGLTGNEDFIAKVKFEGDFNLERDGGDYSSEYRAMRIQNKVVVEFYKNHPIVMDRITYNYSDQDRKLPIPTSPLPK